MAELAEFRLPGDTHRCFICGMTGSGKTRAGGWQLSLRSFDRMPWVIIDFKYDSLIRQIEHVREIDLKSKPPKHPGLYKLHPRPDEHEALQAWLWQVWERGRTGLWIDEGYMVGGAGKKSEAFDAIQTQGRSKRIPTIVLTQRPVWLPRFVVSESDFFQIFHLNGKNDREKVREFAPAAIDAQLPRFWSHWYDVSERYYTKMMPVENDDRILERFHSRLASRNRLI